MVADVEHLYPEMRRRVKEALDDPDAKKLGLYVVSAFRSVELQRTLYNAKVDEVRHAHPGWTVAKIIHEAGNWVAPPGRSNHGPRVDAQGNEPGPWGRAVDLGIPGTPAAHGKWPPAVKTHVDTICRRHGLRSPMAWEDWHYEPDPNWRRTADPATAKEATDMGMLSALDLDSEGIWFCDPADGAVFAFDRDGQPKGRYLGGLNNHPEWNTDGGPPGVGQIVGFQYWHGDGSNSNGRGYQIWTRETNGEWHRYAFPGDARYAS